MTINTKGTENKRPIEFNPTTGTGLDRLVETIVTDGGLQYRISSEDIVGGAMAANAMNEIIVEAIKATGLANDGDLNMGDVRDLNRWVRDEELARWVELHGDDEKNGEETGFHLVQNDGATSRLFAQNAVNTVADGLYHLGFEIDRNRFLNEDGNRNVSVETFSYWLNELLEDDLAGDSLKNAAVDPYEIDTTTGTGLDRLVETIVSDEGLNRNISTSELYEGANAAADMNEIIIEGIKEAGLANDGKLSMGDVRDLNRWVRDNKLKEWMELHGDDEKNGEETGFHLVQNDGATSRLFGQNAVNRVADGLYHLGFEIDRNRFLNEDGDGNVSVETYAQWLNELLEKELGDQSLDNDAINPYEIDTTTGTGLDRLVEMITDDKGLNRKISTSELYEGANAAADMNALIVEAIRESGVANDGTISKVDMYDVNDWLRDNKLDEWTELHGDDEKNGEETGFHLVQNDGATSRLFATNAVNTVADGLYHIGFEIDRGRFLNEDGNKNVSLEKAAEWLNQLLEEDLEGTSLASDEVVDVAALKASAVYQLEGIKVGRPGDQIEVDHSDAMALDNGTFAFSFVAAAPEGWDRDTLFSKDARGNDDGGHVSAFVRNHQLQVRLQSEDDEVWLTSAKGAIQANQEYDVAFVFGENGAHLYLDGAKVDTERDFTGGIAANSEDLAIGVNTWARSESRPDWRADYFEGEIKNFSIFASALNNLQVQALSAANPNSGVPLSPDDLMFAPTTGTGLDRLVETIVTDGGLQYRISSEDIVGGAMAANAMNEIIVEAIKATGLANDGDLNMGDVRDLNRWVRDEELARWVELHGDDEKNGEETGFHLVQNDGATSRLFAQNAVNTVADGLYHLGFEIDRNRFLNEDGNRNVSVETFSYWLNELLEDDLAGDSLKNAAVDPYEIDTTTGTGLDRLVETIVSDEGLNRNISTSELYEGANAAADMNEIIIEGIKEAGLANDGKLSMGDVRDLNRWVRDNKLKEWMELHGDDEKNGEETGFHLVQNDGATSRLFGQNAVNRVADGLYHLGFEIDRNRFLNEDGDGNVSVETYAQWLNELLEKELGDQSLDNDAINPYEIDTTTGTGLDRLVEMITDDKGLNRKISTSELYEGANAAADMNALIVEAIRESGVANDGTISKVDMYDVNDWLRDNKLDEWTELHGDDEKNGEETGFHLVQNDGATSRLFATNAVNTVADGLYHIGFEIDRGRFLNEDGNKNVSLEKRPSG